MFSCSLAATYFTVIFFYIKRYWTLTVSSGGFGELPLLLSWNVSHICFPMGNPLSNQNGLWERNGNKNLECSVFPTDASWHKRKISSMLGLDLLSEGIDPSVLVLFRYKAQATQGQDCPGDRSEMHEALQSPDSWHRLQLNLGTFAFGEDTYLFRVRKTSLFPPSASCW